MGIIVKDEITLNNGLSLKDGYVKFKRVSSSHEKDTELIITGELYASKEHRYNDFDPIAEIKIPVELTKDVFSRKFSEVVYSSIKSVYKTCQDVLKDTETKSPDIKSCKVIDDDIIIEFTSEGEIKKYELRSSVTNSIVNHTPIFKKGDINTIEIKNYKHLGMDIRKMSLWIKVENKLKSESVVMDVEGWNHPLDQ